MDRAIARSIRANGPSRRFSEARRYVGVRLATVLSSCDSPKQSRVKAKWLDRIHAELHEVRMRRVDKHIASALDHGTGNREGERAA